MDSNGPTALLNIIEAIDNPNLHPNLIVRVSGYSAYFNDLNPQLKDEIINRNYIEI